MLYFLHTNKLRSTSMKKICYIVTISLTIKSFFIPQLKYLASNGYNVTVICSPDNELKQLLEPSVRYIPIQIPRGISVISMLKATIELTKLFKKEHFDLVQYSTPNAGLCAAIASKIARINVLNYHLIWLRFLGETGIKRFILKSFEKITCALSTDIECVSNSNLNLAIDSKLFPKEKGTVIFNGSTGGIDLKRFDSSKRNQYRGEIRAKYNIPKDCFVFGFVGRLTRDKGINEILEAFEKIDECKLMMVGYADNTQSLNQELYTNSLNNPNIIYTGPVTNVEKYYSAIDCLLLPSYREGFGNVLIEAAAMGTPAIVTNIPGPIDATEKNVTAYWIEKENSNQLLLAMEEMKKVANSMQDNCIKFATEKFDQNLLNQAIVERKDLLLSSN